ncbi:MAG: pyridoxamine 5'-phosphate oxidase [Opitutales bacterium]
MSIFHLRKEYMSADLRRGNLRGDPFEQFDVWFRQAREVCLSEPNAMTLATADRSGQPSARIVLLKEYSSEGFRFFTNYGSRKGRELAENPQAALVFHWGELERQVAAKGSVVRVSREESEVYFHSRPIGSQLGACVSQQSDAIPNREALERQLEELREKYSGKEIPVPELWGGFLLIPSYMEFWQGRPNRLHDRFRYSKKPEGGWRIDRLAP